MKTRLTLFLLSLLTCAAFAQLNVSNPFFVAGVLKPAAGGGGNITVDFWQTFEFDDTADATKLAANDNHTGATWAAVAGTVTMAAGSERATISTINTVTDTGTRGMQLDNNAAGSIQVDLNTYPETQSIGMWFEISTLTDGTHAFAHSLGAGGVAGSAIAAIKVARSGAAYTIFLTAASDSSTITISAATKYWVTAKYIRNSTCSLRVYTSGGTQVGSEVTVTGRDNATFYHLIGSGSTSSTGYTGVDDFVIDYAAATFPLGP